MTRENVEIAARIYELWRTSVHDYEWKDQTMEAVRMRYASMLAAAALLCSLIATPTALATPPSKHNPPKSIYLALGDSSAFGFQLAKFLENLPAEDPAAFNTGYVDHFARDLRAIKPRIQTINLSCPDETTDSLLGLEPCSYHPPFPLHTDYSDSQIDAALGVLRAHRGQVSPITINIGGADLDRGRSLDHIQANLSRILARLRRTARYTEIIVLGYYNPFVVTVPGSDALARQFNAHLAQAAAEHRAEFVDPLPVFNPPVDEIATICRLTLMCTPLQDTHASDAGYRTLADLVLAASGY
jgi:lysophospholipase L1-like esterase